MRMKHLAQSRRGQLILAIRIAVALVWFVFGLVFKVFNVVPRHREIVATVLGDDLAGPMTVMIGLAEVGVGVWMLSGWRPRTCAALQTVALVVMNTLEITIAKEHLLAPLPMVLANAVLLTLVWWAAIASAKFRRQVKPHADSVA